MRVLNSHLLPGFFCYPKAQSWSKAPECVSQVVFSEGLPWCIMKCYHSILKMIKLSLIRVQRDCPRLFKDRTGVMIPKFRLSAPHHTATVRRKEGWYGDLFLLWSRGMLPLQQSYWLLVVFLNFCIRKNIMPNNLN